MNTPQPPSPPVRRLLALRAFTLIELLCVITIICILASLLMPAIGSARQRANSIACASNLRTIGMAEQLYLQDHNFIFPCIEATPQGTGATVYPAGFQPAPYLSMGGTGGAFGAYGVTVQTTQCPSDMLQGASSSFQLYGSSYDWRPTLDDETTNNPEVLAYNRRMLGAVTGTNGIFYQVKLSHIRQVYDDTRVHFGHTNALYADGHVVYYPP